MTCYRLGKNGKYKEARSRDDKMHSQVIRGFRVKPEWFWTTPLPEDETLREILAGGDGKRDGFSSSSNKRGQNRQSNCAGALPIDFLGCGATIPLFPT